METIYFFVGALSVIVPFVMGWLLLKVSNQSKQIKTLETLTNSIVSNDITESDVRAIVDSRVDKYASTVDREFDHNHNTIEQTKKSIQDDIAQVHRRIEDEVRELRNEININRVVNTRRVTDGGLQSEY
jgi:biopolymer transport protein ExbB/TolQ